MTPLWSRIKAILVTALVFAVAGVALVFLAMGAERLAPSVPILAGLLPYQAQSTIAALMPLAGLAALTAGFLIALALALVATSVYLDRCIDVFADVVLMVVAAKAGMVAGIWGILAYWGTAPAISTGYLQAASILPAIVFALSFVDPGRVRASIVARIGLAAVLLAAAPVLVMAYG